MRKVLFTIFCFLTTQLFSQSLFLDKGKITYERRVSQFALQENYSDEDFIKSTFYEEIKKAFPKVIVDQFVLEFDAQQSLYKAGEETTENKYLMNQFKPDDKEYTYQNFKDKLYFSESNLFENKYKIKDSLQHYTWRFTGETREIAGFECKKAVTVIEDSVVVVAFYTDEITPSVGPMGFHGLPGAILGMAVPRLYLNLFATKVERSDTPIKLPYKPTDKFAERKQIFSDLEKITDIQASWKPMFRWMMSMK